jgi:flagellar hook-associated protein 1 FlgK
MSGLTQLLETARRALISNQLAMNTTGHNIANASTPGYSRQRVSLTPTPPLELTSGLLGTGVMAQGVTRMWNGFLDQQVRGASSTYGRAGAEQALLSRLESLLNEPNGGGLSSALTRFFNAWQDLSSLPDDQVRRSQVMQEGTLLAGMFNQLSQDMTDLRGSVRDDMIARVDSINRLVGEIGDLNGMIISARASYAEAPDLEDQRDLKLRELAQLVDISVVLDESGSATVSVGGMIVVSRGTVSPLEAVAGPTVTLHGSTFDQYRIVSAVGGVDVAVTGGELGGLLTAYNTTLPDALGSLDELARALIEAVNTEHRAGYGIGSPPPTGIDFFMGSSAASIGLDLTDISGGAARGSNPRTLNIAAAGGPPPVAAGDNAVALRIAGLAEGALASLGGASVTEFYASLAGIVGSNAQAATHAEEAADMMLAQLESQRSAVSGVSLDEEMVNLIRYQRAFDAAARVISVTDEMMQTLLGIL